MQKDDRGKEVGLLVTVRPAPSEHFTGVARVDMLFDRLHASDASGGFVTFEAGARTAWHAHPGGQP